MTQLSQTETLLNTKWKRIFRISELAFISGLVIYSVSLLSKCLVVPWIYTSDEVVYTAEIIKLLDLNFNQNFFDIPGTPLMFITAILWAIWYAVLSLSGQIPHDLSIKLFTFQNFHQFYFLIRLLVLIFYGISIFLTYTLGKRLSNPVGGCVAALLLAFFHPYASYSTFVRTESLGICLSLLAFHLTLDAVEFHQVKKYFFAGLLSGVATAARYHFVFASLPQIFTVIFLRQKTKENSNPELLPRWAVLLSSLIGAFFIFGSIVTLFLSLKIISPNWLTDRLLISPNDPILPKALSITRKLWFALGGISLLLFTIFQVPKLRPWGRKIVKSSTLLVFSGFGLGFVLGTPTFLWRGFYLLKSIQFYSDWIDYDRLKLSPIAQYIDMFTSYWKVANPTFLLGGLLILGTILVILRRDKNLYPVLLGAFLAFLAQPILLPTGIHRILPWFPYIAIVQAYPLAVTYDLVLSKNRSKIVLQFVTFCSLILVSFSFVDNGVKQTANLIDQTVVPRLATVNQVSDWLNKNTAENSTIWMSYFSFNEEIHYSWMEQLGAKIPKQVRQPRVYNPWWNNRSPLANQSGYIVASPQDTALLSRDWNNKKPGEGVNPFTEPGFIEQAKFSGGGYDLAIFKFDFKKKQGKE